MGNILRVALLGGGRMARQHAAVIKQLANARLVAVVDPLVPPAQLAMQFGGDVATHTDVHEMLATHKPDVVHVVTPPGSHAELSRACLEAGAHVYVEKPFALSIYDANAVLGLAASKNLRVCAAHQLLFQPVGRSYRRHLRQIGEIVHAESFFTFRTVRRVAGGSGLESPIDQLLDILPHPVYLLLDCLSASATDPVEISALEVSVDGEVRAVIRRGRAMTTLVVSLNARPVESWLRVMGTNGMVEIDFALGYIVRHPGPGASAPAILIKPFSHAWQTWWGTVKALVRLGFRRHRSYPGLAELIGLFYRSIQEHAPPPVTADEIVDTVAVCERVRARLHDAERIADEHAVSQALAIKSRLPPLNGRGAVLLTGGTGLLGQLVAVELRQAGWHVRVPSRLSPRPRHRLPGIEYVKQDLAECVPAGLLTGVETVVHLAAETAGQAADHERNTIRATCNLIGAMAASGPRRLIHISSVAVLRPSRSSEALNENSPVDYENPTRGPYVWAKAESERLARQAATAGTIDVRVIRLAPLVSYERFSAPGRLGRELARLFVAVGRPSNRISICSLSTAANVIRHCVGQFESIPALANLLEAPIPTRNDLVRRLRRERPDLLVLWVPFSMFRILSIAFTLAQKLIRPRSKSLDLYSAFAPESYDRGIAESLIVAAGRSRAMTTASE